MCFLAYLVPLEAFRSGKLAGPAARFQFMKLLVFAHTPPPHHGQSFMVQLMLEGFGGDKRNRARKPSGCSVSRAATGASLGIECYHVNARLSKELEDIGEFRIGKFILLIWYCLEAIWCRF